MTLKCKGEHKGVGEDLGCGSTPPLVQLPLPPPLAVNQTNSPYPKPLIHSNNKVKIE